MTGEDGTIAFTGLAYGAYALVQTKAPEGYNVLSRPVPVTVNETSHLTAEDGWRDAGGQIADSTVQLINTEAIPPKTGDAVHVVSVIGGSTLIGLACAGASLALFGADNLVIPAMALILAVLLGGRKRLCT